MNSKKFKLLVMTIVTTATMLVGTPVFAQGNAPTKSGDILSLGADLSKVQKQSLLDYFKAPEDTPIITVTSDVIIEQLGLDPNDPANRSGGCYSSAYVDITNDGTGIDVDTSNLTEVTDTMLINALITSGITSAKVKVSAPFPVTGTSALAGILAGAEQAGGFEISLKQKETAQKEVETTMQVGEEIGSVEASTIINEAKEEVIKEKPKTEKQVEKIVNNVVNNYDINLSDNSKQEITNLMVDVNKLDLNYNDLKETLNQVGNKFKEDLASMGKELKESGILEKAWSWCKDKWNVFTDWLSNLNTTENEADKNNSETPTSEVNKPALDTPADEAVNKDEQVQPEGDNSSKIEDNTNKENQNPDKTNQTTPEVENQSN